MTKARPLYSVLLHSVIAAPLLVWWAAAAAQTDEIQVYDASIVEPGQFNLTVHNNYVARGSKEAAFPGGLAPNHRLTGVAEWAYGVTDWFEAGLYMPLYSAASGGIQFEGFKLRTLFVVPHAEDRTFFYGVNFEFSYNGTHWDEKRSTSEIRPIVGWHWGPFDLVFNPILDNSYEGFSKLDFAPSTRFAYNISEKWAIAAEEYDDFGPLEDFLPADERSHQLFAVFDYAGDAIELEGGIGSGFTPATDDLGIKLIISRNLNIGKRRAGR
jgi:hypothetical protein